MIRATINFIFEYLWWIPAAFFVTFVVFAIYMSIFGPERPLEDVNHGYLKSECVRRGYGKFDSSGHFRLFPAAQEQVDEMKRLDKQMDVQFKCMAVFALVFMFMFGWAINREVTQKKQLQSECIRLGYGERDTDGNFRLKDGENCTSE